MSANEDGLAGTFCPAGRPPLVLLGIAGERCWRCMPLSWRLSVAWYGKAEQ
ncbi:MAG: hypothetical protein ACLVJH_02585 [Faecalibacterium prausnitzii]